MSGGYHLERFLEAQQRSHETALAEIKQGKKRSHWMWYIFPQLAGLGLSSTAKLYAINDINEAAAYLKHPVLGNRLIEICKVLISLPSNSANGIFGSPDDLKLRSSMTLFSEVEDADLVFQLVLNKFFSGDKDQRTIALLKK
jgi:uncharacterized protein (DUF1810 family)